MTPVDMSELHDPENGSYGDCFRACVASILHLPIEDVPHFCDASGADGEWFRHLHRWANDRGLFVIWYDGAGGINATPNRPGYTITSGPSPRGDWQHSVIFHGTDMVHDPHPSRDGLAGEPVDHLLFAPMDFAEWSDCGVTR